MTTEAVYTIYFDDAQKAVVTKWNGYAAGSSSGKAQSSC